MELERLIKRLSDNGVDDGEAAEEEEDAAEDTESDDDDSDATPEWPPSRVPHYLLLAGVVLTELYMTRQIIYVFFGNRRAASEHARESPAVMTMPLIVLAVCTIALNVVLTPAWPWLHDYLIKETPHFDIARLRLVQPMLLLSLGLVTAGIGLGVLLYHKIGETDPLARAQPGLFRFLENKMWLDELYARTVVAWSRMAARLSDWMDRHFWDGLVRGLGHVGQLFGIFTASFDEHGINTGVDEETTGTRGLGRIMSDLHSGQIQTYLGAIAIGMLALLVLAWLI